MERPRRELAGVATLSACSRSFSSCRWRSRVRSDAWASAQAATARSIGCPACPDYRVPPDILFSQRLPISAITPWQPTRIVVCHYCLSEDARARRGDAATGNMSLLPPLLVIVKADKQVERRRQPARPGDYRLIESSSVIARRLVAPRYFSARLILAGSCHGLSSRGARACSPPSAAAAGLERHAPMAAAVACASHAGRRPRAAPVEAAVRVSSCVWNRADAQAD